MTGDSMNSKWWTCRCDNHIEPSIALWHHLRSCSFPTCPDPQQLPLGYVRHANLGLQMTKDCRCIAIYRCRCCHLPGLLKRTDHPNSQKRPQRRNGPPQSLLDVWDLLSLHLGGYGDSGRSDGASSFFCFPQHMVERVRKSRRCVNSLCLTNSK